MTLRSLIYLMVMGLFTSSLWADTDYRHVLALMQRVQQIHATTSSGKTFIGSGVLIGSGKAVTNCHVTQQATHVRFGRGSYGVDADALSGDSKRDICVLAVPGALGQPVPMRESKDLAVGELVYAAGFSGGRASVSQGKIVALHAHDKARVIQVNAPFAMGASGGGLFDSEGRLVGVLTFYKATSNGGVFFAAPIEWVHEAAQGTFEAVAPRTGPEPFWASVEANLPAFLQSTDGSLQAE